MARQSAKKLRSKVRPEPPPPPEGEQEEPSLTPEEQRATDQGTLRFFGLLLAIGELVALVWAVRSHAGRTEYLIVAGAIALLFGLPMFFAWRSLAQSE